MPELTFQDLFTLKEIRVSLKDELGEKLLLADPNMFKQLEGFWHKSSNPLTKSKIRGFLNDKKVAWNDPLA